MSEALSPEVRSALKWALRRLKRSDRFKAELEAGLQSRGFGSEAIEGALAFLERMRLLDDARTLELWLDQAKRRADSRNKLRVQLEARGLPEERVSQALSDWDEQTELERALEACGRMRSEGVERQKALRRLLSKGFDSEIAESVVRECFADAWPGEEPFEE